MVIYKVEFCWLLKIQHGCRGQYLIVLIGWNWNKKNRQKLLVRLDCDVEECTLGGHILIWNFWCWSKIKMATINIPYGKMTFFFGFLRNYKREWTKNVNEWMGLSLAKFMFYQKFKMATTAGLSYEQKTLKKIAWETTNMNEPKM